MGFNDSYSQARSQILMMPQVPTVNQVHAMINQDENQRIVARTGTLLHERANPTTMLTSRAGGDNYKQKKGHNRHSFCDYCHMKRHSPGVCNKLKNCGYCHLIGHVKGDCYRLIGYLAYFKGQRRANVVTGSVTGSTHLFDANSAGSQEMMHSQQGRFSPCCHQQTMQPRLDLYSHQSQQCKE